MAKAAPKAAPRRGAGRDQARRLQPPLPPSPLQVGQEVPADELGPAEVCGQHERLPHEPGQHDRRPQGLHPQAAAGALPADGLASPQAAAHADRLSASKTASQTAPDACELEQAWDCPCPWINRTERPRRSSRATSTWTTSCSPARTRSTRPCGQFQRKASALPQRPRTRTWPGCDDLAGDPEADALTNNGQGPPSITGRLRSAADGAQQQRPCGRRSSCGGEYVRLNVMPTATSADHRSTRRHRGTNLTRPVQTVKSPRWRARTRLRHKHRQSHGVGDLPRVPNCYLHTDVLALADVMEIYLHSFRAQLGLDPIHYVTLPGAAWVRHSARETSIHLITDKQAYADVRCSVMGGLSCIFQPFAQANNPELGEEDYQKKTPLWLPLGLNWKSPR